MSTPARASRTSQANLLRKLLTDEFANLQIPQALFEEFLRFEVYSRDFSLKLLRTAHRRSTPWVVRRLAVLMLENQILKLSPDDLDEFDILLTELGLKIGPGAKVKLDDSVLKEGYTTTDLRGFVPELRQRLGRLRRVHERVEGGRCTEAALRDFIELSRQDCKLTLARYLFRPEEVVERILERLDVSSGVRDIDDDPAPYMESEVRRAASMLPDYEAAILKRLRRTSYVYWVSDDTGSEINSLVEYPLTTVVLVVKPPGSDVEFEFKRAGRKGPHRLGVVYARGGYTVPPSHRLDGGCMLWLLRYEANSAVRFALIYRLAHDEEAPVPSYLAATNIFSVPVRDSEMPLLSYFTEPSIYGRGFREMRTAMRESIEAFKDEGDAELPVPPNGLGLTAQFVSQVTPAQSLLAGTTSFRLDKLALYLSAQGPDKYFREGLRVAPLERDARRLADSLLEEVLGVYRPPDAACRDYARYVEAAFSVPENRARADETYLSLVRQIGKFWGTLLAVRGNARGESFVARNVGLRSFWGGGEWGVKIIFMDHDALSMPGPFDKNFLARGALPNMRLDERYIWGGSNPRQFAISEVGYLRNIYRTGADVHEEGERLAHAALKDAYVKTRRAMINKPELRRLFSKNFVSRVGDWDALVSGYLRTRGDASEAGAWGRAMKETLDAKGYKPDAFESHVKIVEDNLEFLEKYSFLYETETSA